VGARGDVLGREDARKGLADDLPLRVPEQPLHARVPAGDAPGGVHQEQGVVLDTLHEEAEPLFGLLAGEQAVARRRVQGLHEPHAEEPHQNEQTDARHLGRLREAEAARRVEQDQGREGAEGGGEEAGTEAAVTRREDDRGDKDQKGGARAQKRVQQQPDDHREGGSHQGDEIADYG
jgi:hypothetical protein